jgi:streptogramin lyase
LRYLLGLAISIAFALLATACGMGTAQSPSLPPTSLPPTPRSSPSPSPTEAVVTLPPEALVEVQLEGGPNVLAASATRMWVELHRANGIGWLDPAEHTATVVQGIPVHCAIAADADDVWATQHDSGTVSHLDAATGEPRAGTNIGGACGVGVGQDQVWVTSPDSNVVQRLDPTSGAVLMSVPVPDAAFVVRPLDDLVYASGEGGGGWVWAIDPTDGKVVAKAGAPDVPFLDTIDLSFGSLWGTGRARPELYRLDPKTLKVQATIEVGSEPSGAVADSSNVWVSRLSGGLYRVDPTVNAVSGRWVLPYRWLSWPTVAFDRLWLTSLEDNVVVIIDPSLLPRG